MDKPLKPRPDLFAIFTYVLLAGALVGQVFVIVWLATS